MTSRARAQPAATRGDEDGIGRGAVGCVLFDLGGLLIGFRGVEVVADWLGGAPSPALWRRWLSSPAVRAFERGEQDVEAFADGLIADFELTIEPRRILDEMAGWITDPVPGALELLDELRALGDERPIVACLSNTNAIHWPLLQSPFGPRFDRLFLSHQTGRVKPDPASFDQVPVALGIPAHRVLFFDDQPTNVEAARARGLAAEQTSSPADCRRVLVERGVLGARLAARAGR
ncbi:MAG TPA: HAD-IA family hydrolase [Thermoanaerobaculia bacterium]|nr:HAD-IA family hydrolase [Thermoanaerobaculia bacterium]